MIDLVRDAWLAIVVLNPEAARTEVFRWLTTAYPLFRRLAFFAGTESNLFEPSTVLGWLLTDRAWWLWSVETQHETIALIRKLAALLPPEELRSLQLVILEGPPEGMFGDAVDTETLQRVSDREIWLRLIKIKAANGLLIPEAEDALSSISERFPAWQSDVDESEEFPFWMGDGREFFVRQNTPRELPALKDYLSLEHAEPVNDDWADRCKADFSIAITALTDLAQAHIWPIQRWRTALQVWSEQPFVLSSWAQLKAVLRSSTPNTLMALVKPLSWWLQSLGKVITNDSSEFLELILRLLRTQVNEPWEADTDALFQAINHPVGQLTDAAFRWWYRQEPKDRQGLANGPREVLSLVADKRISVFRYGRILLAANLIALFRVDREWTEKHLLPNFDWQVSSDEAHSAWSGFLWTPRLYSPLLTALKREFLVTASHYDDLGQLGAQYAGLLTFAALEARDIFTRSELASATSELSADGLLRCAGSLIQALNSAGEKRAEYWDHRVQPYLRDIWPKSVQAETGAIANSFARLCMAAGDAFPRAIAELAPWLPKARRGDATLHQFQETVLARKFPEAALIFLDAVLKEAWLGVPGPLKSCLDDIAQQMPGLRSDPRFEQLMRRVRELGG